MASPQPIFSKDEGTNVYIVGETKDTIYQYSLGTAWQLFSILSNILVVTTQEHYQQVLNLVMI
jgi:hypothetical protein